MATVCPMMKIYDRLPPVGNSIALRAGEKGDWQKKYSGYSTTFLDSGTSALALALKIATNQSDSGQNGEVILPAYGCPDLVSAAVYAGLKPVLIDLAPDRPHMSLPGVEQAINARTRAIVAVNFLGIPERIQSLRAIADSYDCLLIEDNAQCFPAPDSELLGDCVITSFGRGKPVSLLEGGMLLTRHGIKPPNIVEQPHLKSLHKSSLYKAKILLCNMLVSPWCYGLLEHLPFLAIGETSYKPLEKIEAMSKFSQDLLGENVRQYLERKIKIQAEIREEVIAPLEGIVDLAKTSAFDTNQRLLRYPILLPDKITRDLLLQRLCHIGLGATSMYKKPLPKILEGVTSVKINDSYSTSQNFADRLLTLPTHDRVADRHIQKMTKIFSQTLYSHT